MRKTFLFLVFALTLLVQIPFISSLTLNCDAVSPPNYQTCMGILSSSLSDEEKNILISNLDYSDQLYPDHAYIYDRNTNLEIFQPPQGVQTQNSFYIKNAWADILAVMPSVLYNGSLYVPDQTKLLTRYNYNVQIPSDYRSSRYPRTSQGDCRRTYRIIENTAENKVYVNYDYQGSGRLVNLDIDSDSTLKAKYNIRVSVDVNHYRWDEDDDGDHRCRYWYDETITDQIQVIDTMDVKYYNDDFFADVQTISQYHDTTKIYPNFSNSLELSFENSEYNFYEFVYNIVYTKEPYYVYTLEAKEHNQENFFNLLKDGSNLLVRNTNECHYKAFNFFQSSETDCSLFGEEFSLSIETDKLKYKTDEIITIAITPSDIPVTLTYGDEIIEAIGEATFIAEPFTNKISARYYGYSAEKIIFLADKERLRIYWDLSVFGLLNYCVYAILKKGIGRFL
ncbi:MAG: hypothetical protein KJ858_02320 [Nanoarchaeota archaeon]|nr:hypothetical protein [Nanoarchaeota archaeon]